MEQEGAETLRRQLLEGEPIDREVQREAGGELRDFRLQVALRKEGGSPIEGFAIYTDITEQKQRERTLRDREQKTAALYTATEQLVSAHTRQEVAEQIQALVSETFDYPLSGVHFVEDDRLVPSAIAPKVSERIPEIPAPSVDGETLASRAYRSGETVVAEDFSEVESEVDHGELRSGAFVPLGDHGVLLVGTVETDGVDDFDVRLLKLLGAHAATVLDRSERETTLREERDLLDRILETSPVAIAVFNPEGEFVQASGRAEEVLGLEKDEITDRTYNDPAWNITTPEGEPLPDAEPPFARVMATGGPVHDVEHTIRWPDGRRRLLSVSGALLRSPDGDLEGAVFHSDDITKRREAERQLRESERRFRKLFTEAPIGIARVDLNGRIIETNAAFRDTLGYDAETLQGQHFKSFAYEEDVELSEDTMEALMTGEGSSFTIEKRYRWGDGSVFWARLTTSFLEHQGDTQIISMVQDIDDQKRYEENLRDAKEEAERMNRLKSAFLANMSHEIRTSLTSIIGFAEMIGEQVTDDAEGTIPQYARLIEKRGHRLLHTLDGVLNFSKLESGEMDPSPDTIDLAAEAKNSAQQFEAPGPGGQHRSTSGDRRGAALVPGRRGGPSGGAAQLVVQRDQVHRARGNGVGADPSGRRVDTPGGGGHRHRDGPRTNRRAVRGLYAGVRGTGAGVRGHRARARSVPPGR
jgi:PAS domain S-box-containing protein